MYSCSHRWLILSALTPQCHASKRQVGAPAGATATAAVMGRRTRRARLLTGAVASHAVSVPAAVDVHQIRATPALLNQTQACLDEHSSRGRWHGETWQAVFQIRASMAPMLGSSTMT